MARPKGDGKGRMGGRKAGTPNKKTVEMRQLMAKFCEENYDNFVEAYKKSKPDVKCLIYLKALKFNTPELSAVEMSSGGERKSFEQELDDLEKEVNR